MTSAQLPVAVEDDGPRDAPAVILVHGLGGTSNAFQPQVPALCRTHRVIRIDLPGAGRSATPDHLDLDGQARAVLAVLTTLDIGSAAIVTHSASATVARRAIEIDRSRFTRIAMLGPVAPPGPSARQAQIERAERIIAGGPVAVAADVLDRSLSPVTRRDRPLVCALVRELGRRPDPRGYAANITAGAMAVDPPPVPPDLPLLVVTGADDGLCPPDTARRIAGQHGSATLVIAPGAGHWVALEAVDAVNDALLRFLGAGT